MSATLSRPAPRKPDGRRARADAGRARVADALFALLARTGEMPGADAVAKEAGVSRRSVFRYFDGRAALEVRTAELLRERMTRLVPPPVATGGPRARIRALVRHRAALFTKVRPVRAFLERTAPMNPAVRRFLDDARTALDATVRTLFPELRGRRLAAVQAAASWEGWTALGPPTAGPQARARLLAFMLEKLLA